MVQDTAIFTMAEQQKVAYGLSNDIFNALERPLTWFSRSRHSLTLNIKCLCIFGPKGAIQIRYLTFFNLPRSTATATAATATTTATTTAHLLLSANLGYTNGIIIIIIIITA